MDDVAIFNENTWKIICQQCWKSNSYLIIKGLINNIIESIYAFFGIPGHESEIKRVNEDPMQ